ncbi:MAG: DNA cytosine methyltransferase [Bifidobacterium psychraerophilum]|uniref:DNA cytosine methyltransferase n=1 Tax=Bifidobacterium psychraerophilum TaxID=218140 RepID=UPI0039EBC26B
MRYISLFSGIEAASCAWGALGWEPVAFSEIEPFPKAVLADRYPNVPDLGDMTRVDWNEYRHAADVVVGGSPCQAFSVAGLRKALDDPRGQLMLEYLRACHAIDPEWIVWENVPGALSAQGGRAFQTLLGAVAELWPDGGAAWRVLDAQFSGVAQRRRRVFLVVNTRDWRRAGPVLFERESVQWDSASSREKRQALASTAQRGVGMSGGDCLTPWDTQSRRVYRADGAYPTLDAREGNAGRGVLTNGFNYNAGARARTLAVSEELSPTLKTEHNPAIYQAFAQNQRDEVRDLRDCAGALAAEPGIKQRTFVYCAADSGSNAAVERDLAPTLTAHDAKSTSYVFGADNAASGGLSLSEETSPTLGTTKTPAVKPPYSGMVRRLTPMECERLQGFADGYTDIPYRGKPHAPDSARYKALGNSMAVPVMRWIGEGISLVDREMSR